MGLVLSLKLGQVLISHAYDKNGNILTVTGTDPVTYTYDSRNRLTSETRGGVTTSYEYDSRGNLVKETQGAEVTIYTYAGDNRLTQVEQNGILTTYEYDLNGNLIGDSNGSVYGYDEENKLVYANVNGVVAEYAIGTDGLRKWKLIGGQSTDYVTDQNGSVVMEGGDEIVMGHQALAKKTADGYYYYIYNAHGDVVMMVDESGNVKNTYAYDAWGKITNQTETVPNSIKYAGEYTDKETGFVYLRNRCYNPTIRRFTSEDPARDELNWYAYCGNNPVMFTDPWGLFNRNTKLELGDTGPDVVMLQQILEELGFLVMPEDTAYGEFGRVTLNAVNAYKEYYGLWNFGEYEGIVGETTWDFMGMEFGSYVYHADKSQNQRPDSGLAGVSDDEVQRRARDKSLPGYERKRYQKEEKVRGLRNKQKTRECHY